MGALFSVAELVEAIEAIEGSTGRFDRLSVPLTTLTNTNGDKICTKSS